MTDGTIISDTEWQVMNVIWARKSALAADVIAALEHTGWNHRTIRTLLARLVEKGILRTESQGNRYRYRPNVTRARCVREVGKSFLERVFAGDAGELLVHFVQHGKVSPAELERLKKVLDERLEDDA